MDRMGREELNDPLARLPLREMIAVIARIARRVRPLADALPVDSCIAIDRAIAVAEQVARGDNTARGSVAMSAAEAAAAAAAAHGFAAVADPTLNAATWAARTGAMAATVAGSSPNAAANVASRAVLCADLAADVAGRLHQSAIKDILGPARIDIKQLIRYGLDEPGTLGSPIDPSEDGPLGPLWPSGVPRWYTNPLKPPGKQDSDEPADNAELVVEVDVPWDASNEDVLALVGEVVLNADDLHRTLGGHGLKIERLEVHQRAGVSGGVPRG